MARRPAAAVFAQVDPIVLHDLETGDAGRLRAGGVLDGLRFDSIELGDDDLTGASLLDCELVDVRAHGARLQGSSLAEVIIERLDAPVLHAARARWRGVSIADSRVGSLDVAGAVWQSVLVRGCKLGYVNLRGADVTNVRFEDCVIDELDLATATLSRVGFAGTRIATLDLSGARLDAVDLRGADLSRITSLAGLAGTTMTEEQVQALAASFAAHLGIGIDVDPGPGDSA